jgi:hypothetical protein
LGVLGQAMEANDSFDKYLESSLIDNEDLAELRRQNQEVIKMCKEVVEKMFVCRDLKFST